jgi:hypothetical protein
MNTYYKLYTKIIVKNTYILESFINCIIRRLYSKKKIKENSEKGFSKFNIYVKIKTKLKVIFAEYNYTIKRLHVVIMIHDNYN